jgi:hypothetical protein
MWTSAVGVLEPQEPSPDLSNKGGLLDNHVIADAVIFEEILFVWRELQIQRRSAATFRFALLNAQLN